MGGKKRRYREKRRSGKKKKKIKRQISHFRHITPHHITPKTIGGDKTDKVNQIDKYSDEQEPWHHLIINRDPVEAINLLKRYWTDENHRLKIGLLKKINRYDAWNMLFGENASPAEAIKIIIRDWTTPEWFQKYYPDLNIKSLYLPE